MSRFLLFEFCQTAIRQSPIWTTSHAVKPGEIAPGIVSVPQKILVRGVHQKRCQSLETASLAAGPECIRTLAQSQNLTHDISSQYGTIGLGIGSIRH